MPRTAKPKVEPTPTPRYNLANNTITMNNSANEHTRAAVEALAEAAARNADAIAAIARAMQSGTAPAYGIYLGGQ